MATRDRKNLIGLSRSPMINSYLSDQEAQTGFIPEKPQHKFSGLLDKNILSWFVQNIPALFRSHAKYKTYNKGEGVFSMTSSSGKNNGRIALLADWASCTIESEAIAELIKIKNPDYQKASDQCDRQWGKFITDGQ